jgi:hypothetical protein
MVLRLHVVARQVHGDRIPGVVRHTMTPVLLLLVVAVEGQLTVVLEATAASTMHDCHPGA